MLARPVLLLRHQHQHQHQHPQAEGETAYTQVQTSASTPGGSAGTPGAPRLSAAHIATTPSSVAASSTPAAAAAVTPRAHHTSSSSVSGGNGAAMRTPGHASDVACALLSLAQTPVGGGSQQLARDLAVSPSVLTPGVAQAMAEAGAEAAKLVAAVEAGGDNGQQQQDSIANLEKIKAKLAVLKAHIDAKTKRMNPEKKAQIQGQIDKLERSLAYVEKQRVSEDGGWIVVPPDVRP